MVYSVLNGLGAGSIGGIIFPLMLQKLIPTLGFAWATRILGFLLIALLVFANLLIRSRPSLRQRQKLGSITEVLPDLSILLDLKFTALTAGIFLLKWGLFIPLTYIIHPIPSHTAKAPPSALKYSPF